MRTPFPLISILVCSPSPFLLFQYLDVSAEGLKGLLEEFDDDGDGAFTRKEFLQLGLHVDRQKRADAHAKRTQAARTASTLFDKIDANNDGTLTLEEFLAAAPAYFKITLAKASRCFDELDADGSKAVSREEFQKLNDLLGITEEKSCDNLFTLLDENDGESVSE
jgi:Ca2+-binding EF-hand superfamily protein